ncbi:MAG: SDR family oxidoreductase [Pyrinomonadaceae bacterium]
MSGRGFAEKVALVTNGARGVGRAVALQLAFAGAYVIVNYRAEADAQIVDELREMGTLAHAVAADTSQSEQVVKLFDSVKDAFGRLDMLVNVAGTPEEVFLRDLSEAAWDEVMIRDLKSAFLCAQTALSLMKNRPSPGIVNVAAAAGVAGRFGGAHYAAAHAGIIGLTRALARELAPRVRVNCVAVGRVREGQERGAASAPPGGDLASTQQMGETLAADDEVARACLYLLSPEARFVTGQTMSVGSEW